MKSYEITEEELIAIEKSMLEISQYFSLNERPIVIIEALHRVSMQLYSITKRGVEK